MAKDWHRMINRLRIWGATTPHDACAGLRISASILPRPIEFLARAGMVRVT